MLRALIAGLVAFAACLVALAQDAPKAAPKKDAPKKAEAKAAPRPAPPVAVEDVFAQQIEQQYGGQFRALYKAELHFMRLVTGPTKAQFDAIAAAGEPALKAALRKYANAMQNGMLSDSNDPHPRTPLTATIADAVQKTLSAEQSARYRKELEARTAAHRRAVALALVEAFDKRLVLSDEQRGRFEEVLLRNWQPSWGQPLVAQFADRYPPAMPDDKILPILTAPQKDIWKRIQKGIIRFGVQLDLAVEAVEDEVWDDDRPADAKAPKPGNGGEK